MPLLVHSGSAAIDLDGYGGSTGSSRRYAGPMREYLHELTAERIHRDTMDFLKGFALVVALLVLVVVLWAAGVNVWWPL